MNNKKNLLVLSALSVVFFCGLALFSCGDDKDDPVTPTPTPSESATIVGVWTTSYESSYYNNAEEYIIILEDGRYIHAIKETLSGNKAQLRDEYVGTYTWDQASKTFIYSVSPTKKKAMTFATLSSTVAVTEEGEVYTKVGTPNLSDMSKLVGSWKGDAGSYGETTYCLNADGTGTLSEGSEAEPFTYIYESTSKFLLITYEDGSGETETEGYIIKSITSEYIILMDGEVLEKKK